MSGISTFDGRASRPRDTYRLTSLGRGKQPALVNGITSTFWIGLFVAAKNAAEKGSRCWDWPFAVDDDGYGLVKQEGRMARAHRLAYETKWGVPILDGLLTLHECDRPRCISHEHLWLGTTADNTADMLSKGRQRNQVKTRCHRGHDFDSVNTYVRPNGQRQCRICKSDEKRRYKARKAAATQGTSDPVSPAHQPDNATTEGP